MPTGLVIDLMLMVLLAVAIGYCWRLDRKLVALRSGADQFRDAARELAETVRQAETAVSGLRQSSKEAGETLQLRIDQARRLSQELAARENNARPRY